MQDDGLDFTVSNALVHWFTDLDCAKKFLFVCCWLISWKHSGLPAN